MTAQVLALIAAQVRIRPVRVFQVLDAVKYGRSRNCVYGKKKTTMRRVTCEPSASSSIVLCQPTVHVLGYHITQTGSRKLGHFDIGQRHVAVTIYR